MNFSKTYQKANWRTRTFAAVVSQQPFPIETGRETEGSPKQTNQYVTHADVQQNEVYGCPQWAKPRKDEQDKQVVEESKHQNDSEADGCHRVAGPAQARWGIVGL